MSASAPRWLLCVLRIDTNSVPPHNGHMAGNGGSKRGRIDWGVVERDVLTTPGMTLSDAAEKWDVSYRTLKTHGGPKYGNWIARRHQRMQELAREREVRLVEILAQDRADDVTALTEIQFRMQRAAVSLLETVFPPADAPVEVLIAAQNRLDAMDGKQLIAAATDCARALTDTGRHLRLMSGQATAIFARADSPDVYIPDSPELAQARELQARLAQSALLAAADGSAIDIEGVLIPPEIACAPVPVVVSPDSPVPPGSFDGDDVGL